MPTAKDGTATLILLSKPYTKSELAARIREALGGPAA